MLCIVVTYLLGSTICLFRQRPNVKISLDGGSLLLLFFGVKRFLGSFSLDGFVDFQSMDWNIFRRFNSDSDFFAPDIDDGYANLSNHDGLVPVPAEN